jgi:hypothetical protein
VVPTEEVDAEISHNRISIQPGANAVWLNGAAVQETDMNPFACVFVLLSILLYKKAGNNWC